MVYAVYMGTITRTSLQSGKTPEEAFEKARSIDLAYILQHPGELTLSDGIVFRNGKLEFEGEYTSTLYDKYGFELDNEFFEYLFKTKNKKKLKNLDFIQLLKLAEEWIHVEIDLEEKGFGRYSDICGCIEILPSVGKEDNIYLFFGEVSI